MAKAAESFSLSLAKPTICGEVEKPLKKLARFEEDHAAAPCGRASLLPGQTAGWLRAYCGG